MEASQKICQLWFVTLLLLACGCGSPGPPLPPSLELPKPVTDLRGTRKGDKVFLSWTTPTETTDRQTVRHLGPARICRSVGPLTTCGTVVGDISASRPGQPASFADTVPRDVQLNHSTEQLTYAVSVLNSSGRSAGLSNQVQVPAAPTLAPPANFSARVTAEGVVLTWEPVVGLAIDDLHYVYGIYRREQGTKTDTVAAEVPAGSSPSEAIDRNFEWEKTYSYRATVVTLVPQPELQVEGDDTPAVIVFAHDTFPPAVPTGLQAVASGVGQPPFIDLIWSPVTDADLGGYNVYRYEQGGVAVKINSALVQTPAYRDAKVVSGHKYFYSVSAVDLRGNESARSEEASESVP